MWQYAIKRLLAFIPVYITVLAAITYLAWEQMDVVDAWLTKNATQETRINKMRQFDLIGNELLTVTVRKKGIKSQSFQFYKQPDKAIHIGSSLDADIQLKGAGLAAKHLRLVYRPNGKTLKLKLPPLPVKKKKAKGHGHGHGHSTPPRRRPVKRRTPASSSKKSTKKSSEKGAGSTKQSKGSSPKSSLKKSGAKRGKVATRKPSARGKESSQRSKSVALAKRNDPTPSTKKSTPPKKRDAVAPAKRKSVSPVARKEATPKARYVTRYLTKQPYKGTVTLTLLGKGKDVRLGGKPLKTSVVWGSSESLRVGEYTLTLKLDRSVFAATVSRNLRKIWKTLKWDFGTSIAQNKPVSKILWERAPISLSLTLPALLITAMLGVIIGLLAAFFRGTWIDRGMILAAVVGMSISSLVYIIVLQYFLAFQLKLFNIYGFSDGWFYRISDLILPTLIQVAVSLGYNARFYRTVMVEESGKDYITTAYAKGVSKVKIIFVHMLRNALIPIITRVFVSLPFLFLGSFLLEIFFGIPGLGSLMILSLTGKTDPPIVIGATTVLCVLYIFCLIGTDIAYAIADPRVRLN